MTRWFLPSCKWWHFSGWNCSNQVLLHIVSLSRSFCNTDGWVDFGFMLNNLVSSANRYRSELTISGKSFIYIMKSVGHKTEPWGMPEITEAHSELLLLTWTCCTLPIRKLWIHSMTFECIPYDLSLHNKQLWGTVSNVFF